MYVLMITPNKFPEGDAGAVRDECFARLYQKLGYSVIHIGMHPYETNGVWNDIPFFSMYEDCSTIMKKLGSYYTYGKRLTKVVCNIEGKFGKPSIIHIYDIPEQGIIFAKNHAKRLRCPIIHDSVEWYSPCEFRYGVLSYPYILKNRTNKVLIDKSVGVIAISRYLENHFRDKGLNTIRIPVIMDSNEYTPVYRENRSTIKLVYAGSPGKKDYLRECIAAFDSLPTEKRERFEFNIFGISRENVKKYCRNEIPKQIVVHGRVTRQEVVKALADSDFSLLLRPSQERYAKAGFPTKSVEAMMNGCAMICNLSSDLVDYLKDGDNAIIVRDCTTEAMRDALYRVSNLSLKRIECICRNARNVAVDCFDYRVYSKMLREFLEDQKQSSDRG